MQTPSSVSPTQQMYLKVLHRLSQTGPVGRVRDIAQELGVTPGTVSTVLNRLHELGLVERERYGGAQLTAAGAAVAECVIRRYEIIKALLIEVFQVDSEIARNDACEMEHVVSPATINRLAEYLERHRAEGSDGSTIDGEAAAAPDAGGALLCTECEAVGFCLAAEAND